MLVFSASKLPPGKSVRPTEPAKSVSPTNSESPASSDTPPGVWPGVWITRKVSVPTEMRSPSSIVRSGGGEFSALIPQAAALRDSRLSMGASRAWISRGAPVVCFMRRLAPTWSKCPWVLMICTTVNFASASASRIRSASSPGSMTAAWRVSLQPTMKQLAWIGPTASFWMSMRNPPTPARGGCGRGPACRRHSSVS